MEPRACGSAFSHPDQSREALWSNISPSHTMIKTAATKMRVAGLPEDYADALASGLWPSCDVLPSREVKAQGVPLKAGKLISRREGLTATVAEHLGWPVETVSSPAQLDPG